MKEGEGKALCREEECGKTSGQEKKKTQKSLRSEAVAQVRNTEAPGAAMKASDQTLLGFSRELGQ